MIAPPPATERVALEIAVAAVTVGAMDVWAAVLHRRFWHGPLWSIHRSHHAPRAGVFEKNDALSTLHAPIAIALILWGCGAGGVERSIAFAVGVGMTVFGALYVLIHDGLVHRRLPVGVLLRVPVLRAIVRAHEEHHRGAGGVPYGILFGPWELRRARVRPTPRARNRRPIARP